MEPHKIIDQYLEGAITFAELIVALARYHNYREITSMNSETPTCANCGGSLETRRPAWI